MSMREGGGKPLPKFGEWDVNNPASADGFTVIFSRAKEEKKGSAATADSKQQTLEDNDKSKKTPTSATNKKKWFCFI